MPSRSSTRTAADSSAARRSPCPGARLDAKLSIWIISHPGQPEGEQNAYVRPACRAPDARRARCAGDRLPRARRGRAAHGDGRRRADRHRRGQRRWYPRRLRPGRHRAPAVRDRLRADEPPRRQRRRLLRLRHEGRGPARGRGDRVPRRAGLQLLHGGCDRHERVLHRLRPRRPLRDQPGVGGVERDLAGGHPRPRAPRGRHQREDPRRRPRLRGHDPPRDGRLRPRSRRAGTSGRSTPTSSSARASGSACCSSSPASSASRRRRCSREEARDPFTTIPRAIYAAIILMGAFYIVTSLSAVSAVGADEAQGRGERSRDGRPRRLHLQRLPRVPRLVPDRRAWSSCCS